MTKEYTINENGMSLSRVCQMSQIRGHEPQVIGDTL